MGARAEHTHYQTLGVSPQAAPEAVRRAYRRQAQRYHPDKAPGDPAAQARMACINEAYAVLSHPQRRASYDEWMRARRARARAEQAVQRAQPSRFSAGWPWGLMFATASFAVGAVGLVAYKAVVPPVASPPVQQAAQSLPAPR